MQHLCKTLLIISAAFLVAATWTTGQQALAPVDIMAGSSSYADIDLTPYDYALLQVSIDLGPNAGPVVIELYKSTDGTLFDSDPFISETHTASTVWSYQLGARQVPFVRVVINNTSASGYARVAVNYAGVDY